MESSENFERPQQTHVSTWVVLAFGALFVLVWVLLIEPHIKFKAAGNHAGVGQPLPVLELQPLTGTEQGISLENVRGKVVLVNYWGTWCPPCVAEFPHMVELWDRYRGTPDFVFLSVSSTFADRENVEEVREATAEFLKQHETAMPTYIDADGVSRQVLSGMMGTPSMAYPTTVLLDRNGVIRETWVGYTPGTEQEMEQLVSKVLAEKDAAGQRRIQ